MAYSATKSRPWPLWKNAASTGRKIAELVITECGYARRTRAGQIGSAIVLFYLVLAVFGTWLAPHSATEFHYDSNGAIRQLQPPSSEFWFGTDQFGRDVYSRVLSGAGSLIGVSVAGAALGLLFGSLLGLVTGYLGGKLDEMVMRILDGVMSFPALLLALLVLTTLGSGVLNVILTIGIVFSPAVARIVRSATLALKELEFVQSARLRGERSWYILLREILPNVVPVLGAEAPIRLSYAIFLVSSLGFLGLGVQPPSPDWGLMISEGRKFLVTAPWVALVPVGAVSVLIVGVNLLVDGLRQARSAAGTMR